MGEFGRWLGREFPRVLASLGPAIAVVGVVVYAMATSFRETRDSDVTISVVLMVGGLVLFIAGVLAIRAGMGGPSDPPDEPAPSRAAASRAGKRG
jgi:hypothetical protein